MKARSTHGRSCASGRDREGRAVSTWLGTAWGLGSAISWACANASIQVASRRVGTWSALVWAQLFGGALAAGAALWQEPTPTYAVLVAAAPFVVGAGVAGAVAYGGLFEALRRGQVAIVSPIISAWSVVSVVIAALAGQPPSAVVALGVAMVVCGNVVVARSAAPPAEGTGEEETPPPGKGSAVVWAVAAACGFGVMVPLLARAGEHIGRLWAVPWVWAVELLVLAPVLLRLRLLAWPEDAADVFALGRAAVFEVGGFIALSLGLGVAAVSVVSPVSSLSTMGSVLIGVLLLRERVARAALGGAVLASAGVVVVNL